MTFCLAAPRRGSKFDIKDDDADEAAVTMGTYELKFLGQTITDSPGGAGVIATCMAALKVQML